MLRPTGLWREVTGPRLALASPLRQLFRLTVRYAEVLARDIPNLALLLLQSPAIAIALLVLFGHNFFAATTADAGDALRAVMALHMITAPAIWLGASNAAREATKVAAIYARERLVSLNECPHVMAKVVVLSVLCLFQAAAFLGIFGARIELPGSVWEVFPTLLAAIFLTQPAGLSMCLLVSATGANSDRAMTLVPILLIPQLFFAGALIPVERMLAPAAAKPRLG